MPLMTTAFRRLPSTRLLSLLTLFLLCGLLSAQTAERPEKWAKPVKSRYLKNAYRLDAKLYRSAQPSAKAFKEAKQLGVTDVLNLRANHNDKSEAKGTDLALHRIKSEADELSEQQLLEALQAIQKAKGPVLVHCWHGSDRTGAVCAMYRIIFNNWSKEDALDEMVNGGFGYHKMYKNIIQLINQVDTSKMKAALLTPVTAPAPALERR
jgi:tyrosine-protein phosphatase SIW14